LAKIEAKYSGNFFPDTLYTEQNNAAVYMQTITVTDKRHNMLQVYY